MAMTLAQLTSQYAQVGTIRWIGVRAARKAPVQEIGATYIRAAGLEGDYRQRPGKRAVTLIQWEHLAVIAALGGLAELPPHILRRNICISDFNLLGLKNEREFRLGEAVLMGTGLCAPCSQMERALGTGGYAAMRGHGGITAQVVTPGKIRIGDTLEPI